MEVRDRNRRPEFRTDTSATTENKSERERSEVNEHSLEAAAGGQAESDAGSSAGCAIDLPPPGPLPVAPGNSPPGVWPHPPPELWVKENLFLKSSSPF